MVPGLEDAHGERRGDGVKRPRWLARLADYLNKPLKNSIDASLRRLDDRITNIELGHVHVINTTADSLGANLVHPEWPRIAGTVDKHSRQIDAILRRLAALRAR